ncbi:MAG: glycosyltransferase [Bacteroidetes bacterium]|nr:MAG: glycosyltransferase [Bacteroidota bacterium]
MFFRRSAERPDTFFVSRELFLDAARLFIRPAATVADIGCGIRPQRYIVPQTHYCVDAHRQYLEHYRQRGAGFAGTDYVFINALWGDALNDPRLADVETIFALDVIEHIEKEEGKRLLERTVAAAKEQVVIFTPLGFVPQHHEDGKDAWGLDGGKWQEHLSGWLPEEFAGDWTFLVCEDFHTHDNMQHRHEKPVGAFFAFLNKRVPPPAPSPDLCFRFTGLGDIAADAETLISLANQRSGGWEAVVSDGVPGDELRHLVEALSTRSSSFQHRNDGQYRTTAPTVIRLAAGDRLLPDAVDTVRASLTDTAGESVVIFTDRTPEPGGSLKRSVQQTRTVPAGFAAPAMMYEDLTRRGFTAMPRSVAERVESRPLQFLQTVKAEALFRAMPVPARIVEQAVLQPAAIDADAARYVRIMEYTWLLHRWMRNVSFSEAYRAADIDSPDGSQSFIQYFFDGATDEGSPVHNALIWDDYIAWLTAGLASLNRGTKKRILQHGRKVFSSLRNLRPMFERYHAFFSRPDFAVPAAARAVPVPVPADRKEDAEYTALLHRHIERRLKESDHDGAQLAVEFLVRATGTLDSAVLNRFAESAMVNGNLRSLRAVVERLGAFAQLSDAGKAASLAAGDAPPESGIASIGDPVIRENLRRHLAGAAMPFVTDDISAWTCDADVHRNVMVHSVKASCRECGTPLQRTVTLPIGGAPGNAPVLCHSCAAPYTLTDRLFREWVERRNAALPAAPPVRASGPRVALVMRYSSVISGGVNMIFQYAEWLRELGCTVTVHSNEPNSPLRKFTGTFSMVKNAGEVPAGKYDAVFCMCAADVPVMLQKYPKERVALICQGYEGYHYGHTYEELRADKYIFDEIHALPAAKFAVSRHLTHLFAEKFGQQAYYIPNGTDRSVFRPDLSIRRTSPSVLFVGNPYQQLKGADMLLSALSSLQASRYAMPGLTLHIAIGGGAEKMDHRIQTDRFAVQYHVGLGRKEMAALMNSVDLVVNTSWYEGFSLPMLEAMACGTPVITTRNMGAESFCEHGKNAFVVPYGDVSGLATAMLAVLSGAEDLAPMLREAQKTADEYSTERSVRAFVNETERFLGVSFSRSRVEPLVRRAAHAAPSSARDRSDRPKFTVLVPTYNQAGYIPDTLDSLRRQTVEDWEAVVVNDGSTDNTRRVIERYALADDRIRTFHKSNGGVASALNEALRQARGEWILWLSSDDLFEADKLKVHERHFAAHPEARFFYTNYSLLYQQTQQKVPGYPGIAADEDRVLSFFYTNYINGISICIHRSVFSSVGFFNEILRDGQDYDMWLRIARQFPLQYIDARTCTYRVHPEQGASKFPEAGIYDSALSCAQFLNTHPYAAIFPKLDPADPVSVDTAVKKTFSIVMDQNSFINKLGFGPLLIDRLHEWVSAGSPPGYRTELNAKIRQYIVAVLGQEQSEPVREMFATLYNAGTDDFRYRPRDVFAHAHRFILERKRTVAPAEAEKYDRYMKRFDAIVALRTEGRKHVALAVQAMERRSYDEALRHIAAAEGADLHDVQEELSVMKGCAHLGLQDLPKAREAFEETLARNPESSEACAGLGEVFFLAGMDRESKTMFEWAVRYDASNQSAMNGLCRANTELGLPEDDNALRTVSEEVPA